MCTCGSFYTQAAVLLLSTKSLGTTESCFPSSSPTQPLSPLLLHFPCPPSPSLSSPSLPSPSLLFLSQQLPGTNTLVMMLLHLKITPGRAWADAWWDAGVCGSLNFTLKSQATLRKQKYSFRVERVAYQLKAPTTKPDNPSFTPQTYGRKNQSQKVGLWPPHTCLPPLVMFPNIQ